MSKIQFSSDQEKAIKGRGHALLVSAAAGSGKTTVLVERVLRYLKEQGGDIRRLMIMTYTRAAADEMRMKIKRAVDQAVAEEGGDHLMEQSALIESAQIGTIHSICLDLIIRHFQKLDLDPRCRLIEEQDESAMLEEQVEELVEAYYSREDEEARLLLAAFSGGRDDEELKGLLKEGMAFLEGQPLPDRFIDQAMKPFSRTEEGLFACFGEDGLYQYFKQLIHELLSEYDHLLNSMERDPYFAQFPPFLDFLRAERLMLDPLLPALEKRKFSAFREEVQKIRFATLRIDALTEKGSGMEAKEQFKKRRDRFKKNFAPLLEAVALSEQQELERIAHQGQLLKAYFSACKALSLKMQEERRRLGYISYQDMERFAVQLLVEDYDPAADLLKPSSLALDLRQDYDEIIIDEFQDSNRAQDLIFRALSDDGKNLFMVGDIKQSIYRFRGAEPEIFAEKRAASEPFSEVELKKPTVLELKENYRSHPGVIRLVNGIFESIMSPALGGVCYDEREKMQAKREFDEGEAAVAELHHLLPQADPRTGKKLDVTVQNARHIAAWIKAFKEEGREILLPGGGRRPATYRDFAILLRTVTGSAAIFERELSALGVPVINDKESTPFYELWEVQSILSYLMVLNNPYDDVAMVSLLYGDYFRFSVGSLGALRRKNTFLYEDLLERSKTDQEAANALEKIQRYRALSRTLYVYELMERIFSESGIMEYYASKKGGAELCANLEELCEEARRFEQDGYKGLYGFVQHIRQNSAAAKSGVRLQAEEDAVQIMSIHRSKGLEFPICILADLQKRCNLRDKDGRILLHPRYGAAVEEIRPELFFRCRSLGQKVLASQTITDSISEEERVLYVALTRAQSRLLLCATVAEDKSSQWAMEGAARQGALPPWLIRGKDASFARWIFTLLAGAKEGALLRGEEGDYPALGLAYQCPQALSGERVAKEEEKTMPLDAALLRARLHWRYPHEGAMRLPAKLSVSELKGMRLADEEAEELLEEQIRPAKPRFLSHFAPRGNEIGNAVHQALQFADFSRLAKAPEEELSRLVAEGFILPKQKEMISLEKIQGFIESESFKTLLAAEYYSKEERFLFPLPAEEIFGKGAEGEILIQGVIDCYSVFGKKAVLLDYKTDRVEKEQQLIDRYRVQMELYAEALGRMKGLEVVRKEIYSFALGKTIVL